MRSGSKDRSENRLNKHYTSTLILNPINERTCQSSKVNAVFIGLEFGAARARAPMIDKCRCLHHLLSPFAHPYFGFPPYY